MGDARGVAYGMNEIHSASSVLDAPQVDADPWHVDEAILRDDPVAPGRRLVLIVDHDQAVGPPARHPFRSQEQGVRGPAPALVEVESVRRICHRRAALGRCPVDGDPRHEPRDGSVDVDDVGCRVQERRDRPFGPDNAAHVEDRPRERELVDVIESLFEHFVVAATVGGRIDSPAARAEVRRVRQEEVADRVRHGGNNEERPDWRRIRYGVTRSVVSSRLHFMYRRGSLGEDAVGRLDPMMNAIDRCPSWPGFRPASAILCSSPQGMARGSCRRSLAALLR